jgi:hypothetical protein
VRQAADEARARAERLSDQADAQAAAAQRKVDEANERREAVASDGRKLAADADTGPLDLDDMTKEELLALGEEAADLHHNDDRSVANKLFGKKTIIDRLGEAVGLSRSAREHGNEVGTCCCWRGCRTRCRERRGLHAPGAPERWKPRCSVARP